MKTLKIKNFYGNLLVKSKRMCPLSGQLELTFRCNLNCIHCYLGEHPGFQKNPPAGPRFFGEEKKELSFEQWQKIIDQLQQEGCLILTLTGGEPLFRNDFFAIYEYAKNKGFIISIFTNGLLLDDASIKFFKRLSPHSIEMTLNGITKRTYESITKTPGSFEKAMEVIKKLAKAKLPLSLKVNGLKQNKHEILKIKAFTEKLLGKHKFKLDSLIVPRWRSSQNTNHRGYNRRPFPDANLDPINNRLSPREIEEIEEKDFDMQLIREERFHSTSGLWRQPEYLYHCNSWQKHFFISPYGELRFCCYSDKFSTDLTKNYFRDGFYKEFPRIFKEKFHLKGKKVSKCIYCKLRSLCQRCPSRASLETGDEEKPVSYYCQIAKNLAERKQSILNSK